MADSSCCEITNGIAVSATCATQKGGIEDIRISCVKMLASITQTTCVANDAKITDFVTDDPITPVGTPLFTPSFYTVATKDKQNSFESNWEFNIETGTVTFNETMTLTIEVKERNTYCVLKSWIGQQVVVTFRERGTDRLYMMGFSGEFYVQNVVIASGTTEFTPIIVTLQGTDIASTFLEVFDTDAITTTALMEQFTV
jgi:hypothetical protein